MIMMSFFKSAESKVVSNLYAISVCLAHTMVGPTIILVNKYILYDLKFSYPIFLSCMGVVFSGCFARVVVHLGFVKLQHNDAVNGYQWFRRILPICITFATSLAFGNVAYLFLNVGFIQMFKSFMPCLIVVTYYLAGVEYPNRPIIASVLIISIGTAATCTYTPGLSLLGLTCMMSAEVLEAFRLVMTQFLLQNLKFSVLEGQYMLAPPSAAWLLLACYIFEYKKMVQNNAFQIMVQNPGYFLLASSLGLVVNFLSYYVIQATSSLTLKIIGGVRNVFTITVGVIRWGEIIDFREGIGYTVAFIGFMLYSCEKAGYFEKGSSTSPSSLGGPISSAIAGRHPLVVSSADFNDSPSSTAAFTTTVTSYSRGPSRSAYR